jgi:serine palmitoyltransferase
VFSAAMPAALSVAASESIMILRDTPSILSTLQDNVRTVRSILDRLDCITIPSHHTSPIIHIHIRPASASSLVPTAVPPSALKPSNPASVHPRNPQVFDIEAEEKLLQEVVDDVLAQGILTTRAKRLRGQEMSEAQPSIRLAISSAFTKKECEKAATAIKTSLVKVLGKRR